MSQPRFDIILKFPNFLKSSILNCLATQEAKIILGFSYFNHGQDI